MRLPLTPSDDTLQLSAFRFMPQHHAIGVLSPRISQTVPPEDCTHSETVLAAIAAPRQLFPARAGSIPNADATLRLRAPSLAAHSESTTPQASLPLQFIVGSRPPLNWKRHTPPGRRTRSISRMYCKDNASSGRCCRTR